MAVSDGFPASAMGHQSQIDLWAAAFAIEPLARENPRLVSAGRGLA